ncbi:MAG: hypothetical protein KGI80_04955 [Verrucomicrobiota bacterium]|nr:hypothetical protein [Verrucomicrobiota bacterium]
MNQYPENKFDWGETVRIKSSAPFHFRPGEIVSVCGMTKTDSKVLADKYNSYIGEWVYTIEYLGGVDTEIPERYLEKCQFYG